MRVLSYAEASDLHDAVSIGNAEWPEFIHHGAVANRYWGRLYDEYPDFQLLLYDDEAGAPVAKGQTVPVRWDGTTAGLPGGVDDVLEQAFAGTAAAQPSALCALVAVVRREWQGRGLSRFVLEAMRAAATAHGLEALIAPVRPTLKERYPLTPMERYVRWARPDGLPFDPWIRVHHRLGAELLALAPRSLVITGTVPEWETWTEMAFPETGAYVVPGAVQPVEIDRELDLGRYDDANVWMVHRVVA